MGVLRVLVFNFMYFLLVQGRNDCQPSFCENKHLPIRFPFRLPDQPQDCGFPGFDLSCGILGEPILNLTYSGSFEVRNIDYKRQTLELYDTYGCRQSRFLKLNLSSSPFKAAYCMLKWDSPNCMLCEEHNVVCELKNSTTQEVQCRKDPREVKEIIRVIIIGISLPIVLCTVGWICYKCMKLNSLEDSADNSMMIIMSTERASQVAPPSLNDSKIESYETVILGESCRISGPNGPICPICPICLEDYLPKDTLRCIPECQHCFHAYCIDEWLRLKSICPVCRNSPS